MVRRLRLHRLRVLLRGAVLRQERHQLDGVHLRDLRGHLRHATGGILVLRPVRRPRGRKAADVSITVMSAVSSWRSCPRARSSGLGVVHPDLRSAVQGFATGGEYGTSATYMSEAATANRRGFLSSFQYVTLIGGHVLAQFTLLIALQLPGHRGAQRLGMADRLLHRRHRRPCGALDSPLDGRVAERVAPGRTSARARTATRDP